MRSTQQEEEEEETKKDVIGGREEEREKLRNVFVGYDINMNKKNLNIAYISTVQ